jgi:hypothetical protein
MYEPIILSILLLTTIQVPRVNSGIYPPEDHRWTTESVHGYWKNTSHLNFESYSYKGIGSFREASEYFVDKPFKEWTIWNLEWGNTFPKGDDNLNALTYLMSLDNGEGTDWLAIRVEYTFGHENKKVWIVKVFWGANNKYRLARRWNFLEKNGITNVRCEYLSSRIGDDGILRRRVVVAAKKDGNWARYGGVQYEGSMHNHTKNIFLTVKVWKKGELTEPNHINGTIGIDGWENFDSR